MIALTDDQLKTIIRTADSLHSLVGVNNLSYPELVAIQTSIVDDLIENAMPIPETMAAMALDPITPIETAIGVISEVPVAEKLDADMFSLADKLVAKMSTLVSISDQPHELVIIVETLATLRGAFYDKGPTIQVNTQNNHNSDGESTGDVKRFKGLLKR